MAETWSIFKLETVQGPKAHVQTNKIIQILESPREPHLFVSFTSQLQSQFMLGPVCPHAPREVKVL